MTGTISILTDNRTAGHCTGSRAFRILQSVLGSRLQQFACGMQIDIALKRKGSGSEVIP